MKHSRGFTLFEIMAALAIFMVGIVGVLALLTTAIGMHKEAQDREVASLAADEVLAHIRTLASELERDPETAGLLPIQNRPVPGRAGYTYSVSFEEGNSEVELPIKARVEIAWKRRGESRLAEFISFVDLRKSFAEQVRESKRTRGR